MIKFIIYKFLIFFFPKKRYRGMEQYFRFDSRFEDVDEVVVIIRKHTRYVIVFNGQEWTEVAYKIGNQRAAEKCSAELRRNFITR